MAHTQSHPHHDMTHMHSIRSMHSPGTYSDTQITVIHAHTYTHTHTHTTFAHATFTHMTRYYVHSCTHSSDDYH